MPVEKLDPGPVAASAQESFPDVRALRLLPVEQILQKSKRLRRELLQLPHLQPIRIAVLGGATTNELIALLELLLLSDGFKPAFYQSEYNKYYEDAVFTPEKLRDFRPDIVYLHTHIVNIALPSPAFSKAQFDTLLNAETARFQSIWSALHETVACQIIQNNFEHPPYPVLGNLDSTVFGGQTRFINEINLRFADAAGATSKLVIQDINALAARFGRSQWFHWERWYSYKILTSPAGSLALAGALAATIGAIRGRSKKCLVLDLDNTLWGGVIGDDGLARLQIGKETAVAEAYTAFQNYCLALHKRGILLAVCSKNDEEVAKSGFGHPDSVLKLEHFSCFKANWAPKHENIQAIASQLNLGLDSFVFVDDNPAERAIVAAQLPAVAVPDIGSDVVYFPSIIQDGCYFEIVTLSKEDLARSDSYAANAARSALQSKFSNYGEYLDSLRMSAEIAPFQSLTLERVTQLINKTNQFNLTTRRYTFAEIEAIAGDPNYLTLSGRLSDTFGDNGLISAIVGRLENRALHIDLWIMSCRVLQREMEFAMQDALVERAKAAGAERIFGYYRRSEKNGMVENHYSKLGFSRADSATDGNSSIWELNVSPYEPKTQHIKTSG